MRDETSFVVSEILRLVRNEGCRFRDIAVLTTDMEAYHDIINRMFRNFSSQGKKS